METELQDKVKQIVERKQAAILAEEVTPEIRRAMRKVVKTYRKQIEAIALESAVVIMASEATKKEVSRKAAYEIKRLIEDGDFLRSSEIQQKFADALVRAVIK